MEGVDLSEVYAQDTRGRNHALYDGREGAEDRPHRSTVTVRFGVEEDEGGEGQWEGEGGGGGEAQSREIEVAEAAGRGDWLRNWGERREMI